MFNTLTHKLMIGLAASTVALGLMFGSASPAFAQDSTPPVNATERAENRDGRLANTYQRLLNWEDRQALNLERAAEVAAKAQTYIDEQKAAGRDTSGLEAALASFNAARPEAQADHDAAAAVLATHAGFDDAGAVTDVSAARQTVIDAGQSLASARITLAAARLEMRAALADFRQANGLTR
jgi:hypothetical protein